MKIKLFNFIIALPRIILIGIQALVISISFVTAVAVAAGNSYNIVEVAKAEIESKSCNYLGKVWGSSDWGKLSMNARKHKAEDRALRMASELRATHLVWRENSTESDSYPHASGDAYHCGNTVKTGNIAKDRSNTEKKIY
ncbi:MULTISPECIES: hypothetical protein [Nitrosomonas]|uniref:Uncharacterized protein n=2 Tax=Pseudomonadota TaxID=1224 RepID=A0A0F7KIM9_9PROT|nr:MULTISPECIES: hypothetical protein [Nitrosomonas]AKH38712.1 hypothetical protein AAW31_14300 [Nitrosomonas communis]TYP94324.1 hypothetical protein BCL69_100294 [Nitrosomonas communis]UVS60789.1 hypothetical protein NX761_15015 [Nitrosomonas sp. PLL12]SDW10487.1 hypothetical protein SAMN05421882_100320 [Nitrosomonas communis]